MNYFLKILVPTDINKISISRTHQIKKYTRSTITNLALYELIHNNRSVMKLMMGYITCIANHRATCENTDRDQSQWHNKLTYDYKEIVPYCEIKDDSSNQGHV